MAMGRVSEETVSRILWSIHAPPNRRDRPRPGDVPGEYSFWFDGGACQVITGSTRYVFADGTTASVAVMPQLMVAIRFPDGETVTIQQG